MNRFRAEPIAVAERVFVSCGMYESLIYENRSLVPLLQSTGMDVRYVEARDGHNWENWRDRLREGLSWLFPARSFTCTSRLRNPMAHVTRKIGLVARRRHLLAALLRGDPRASSTSRSPGRATPSSFEVERVTIEPFDLRQPCSYDVVLDRLTHWYHTSREWIKKAILMDGLYVLNNPWAVQSMEKHTTYCAMMQLGMPIPETWMVPPKAYEPTARPRSRRSRATRSCSTSARSASAIGYPLFMKPYDGGGWRASAGSTTRPRCASATRRAASA